ncbi:unnamed protein product [Adineta ricciae]|uniref:Phosphoinositide phospholipase C n=1 Tax=Adineta ricciae TaxID=249248 RepID=A0A814YKU5_ADIRI|nr:unnamed protein product [Adineta ricciae]
MNSNQTEHINRIITELKTGSFLTKQKRNGEQYLRHFYLEENEEFLSYHQSEKFFSQAHRYYIKDIDEVRIGFHTLIFDGLVKQQIVDSHKENLAFSIFYNNYRDELHLMANDAETRNVWISGLQYLIVRCAQNQQQHHTIRDTNWILSQLRFADKDKSSTMDRTECQQLLVNSLNVQLAEDVFENLFNVEAANKNADGHLTPDEFFDFFQNLTQRDDLFELMQKFVENGDEQSIDTIFMNVNELLHFLQTVQKQKIMVYSSKDNFTIESIATREQALKLIEEYELEVELKEQKLLSLDGFRNLLLSDEFSIMKPWCSCHPYQDMTRPLSDYYINASHNTYLFNNQIYGDSNPEAYNRALRAGCRVLEIDCYDGDDGQPIVTHGHTFVRSCSFESIIRLIQPNLFKTSPYPVILSIENHCSIKQQKEMARILREILGNQLLTQSPYIKHSWLLPSPEDLKYKVLIRSTKQSTCESLENTDTIDPSDLFIYLENVPYREYNYSKDHYNCCQSSSLSENQCEQICQSDPMGLIKQTHTYLLRMYPNGLRQDSSNPNPITAWNFGLQMVALNYQSDDRSMQLCYGKFLDNGSCGYVLKPNYLLQIEKSKFNPLNYSIKSLNSKDIFDCPVRLTITIISGQFFDRTSEDSDDIPDPYVIISTHGIPCDQQTQKTNFIENNGFNPNWNETFQFDIQFPQMCLLRFDVCDYDIYSHDDHLAYFCLPVLTIQPGYRHIHLRAKDHDKTYSTLFVHVTIDNRS